VLHTVLLKSTGDGFFDVIVEQTGEQIAALPSLRLAKTWADAYLLGWGKGYDDGADLRSEPDRDAG
jgi:hypothetical protein